MPQGSTTRSALIIGNASAPFQGGACFPLVQAVGSNAACSTRRRAVSVRLLCQIGAKMGPKSAQTTAANRRTELSTAACADQCSRERDRAASCTNAEGPAQAPGLL